MPGSSPAMRSPAVTAMHSHWYSLHGPLRARRRSMSTDTGKRVGTSDRDMTAAAAGLPGAQSNSMAPRPGAA